MIKMLFVLVVALVASSFSGTKFYAKYNSANVDSSGMWNTAANGSGTNLLWANLAAGDTLEANGDTAIELRVNFTCAQIQTMSGGGFKVGAYSPNRLFTCNIVAGTSTCVNVSDTISVAGNIIGGSASNARGIAQMAGGNLTLTHTVGTITGGSNTGATGCYCNNAVIATVNNVTGGSSSNVAAIADGSLAASLITLNGIATGGSTFNTPAISISSGTAVVASTGSIACPSTWQWPIQGRIKWDASAGNKITMYNSSSSVKYLSVPGYPTRPQVQNATTYANGDSAGSYYGVLNDTLLSKLNTILGYSTFDRTTGIQRFRADTAAVCTTYSYTDSIVQRPITWEKTLSYPANKASALDSIACQFGLLGKRKYQKSDSTWHFYNGSTDLFHNKGSDSAYTTKRTAR